MNLVRFPIWDDLLSYVADAALHVAVGGSIALSIVELSWAIHEPIGDFPLLGAALYVSVGGICVWVATLSGLVALRSYDG
jgi:hypothetical protein